MKQSRIQFFTNKLDKSQNHGFQEYMKIWRWENDSQLYCLSRVAPPEFQCEIPCFFHTQTELYKSGLVDRIKLLFYVIGRMFPAMEASATIQYSYGCDNPHVDRDWIQDFGGFLEIRLKEGEVVDLEDIPII